MSRKRRGKLEKIVYGLAHLEKYPAIGVMMASLGCIVGPSNLSVSDDGRYLAVPISTDENELRLSLFNTERDKIALIDLQGEDIRYFEVGSHPVWWTRNTRDKVAHTFTDDEEGMNIEIISENGREVIQNSGYGDFSSDGRMFAYSSIIHGEFRGKEWAITPIVIRDLRKNVSEYPGIYGIALDFSPDGNRLLTIGVGFDGEGIDVGVYDVKNKKRMRVYKFQEGEEFEGEDILDSFPRWIDNDRVLFKIHGERYGEGGELFIGNVNGDVEQITFGNDDSEILPSLLPSGEIGFLRDAGIRKQNVDMGMLWTGRRTNTGWSYETRGILTMGYLPVGDKIVYFGEPPAEWVQLKSSKSSKSLNEEFGLYLIDLDDRRNTVDLQRRIREDFANKRER